MAGFKRPKYLTCFYCGRKTSTRYDGRINRFDCPNCEATNYLDENGEITDPPVGVTESPTPAAVKYAVPLSVSPPSSPSHSIFCDTCLKNQHLVTASLAQYLPDDPESPEYAEAEKKYFRFRKNLEKRYPQICRDCEPKVRRRIEQSAYTAKTDVLRRMLDRSRSNRALKQRSGLDHLDSVGRWLRVTSLVLQLLWHCASLWAVLEANERVLEEGSLPLDIVRQASHVFDALPAPEKLIRWSILAACCGSWWNPRFVQTVRGFTKHVVGLQNWYIYQVMAVVLRLLCKSLLGRDRSREMKVSSYIAGHLLMMGFVLLTYRLGAKSVRTDTRPLFASRPLPSLSHQQSVHGATPASGDDDEQDLSGLLDDMLPSAPSSKHIGKQSSTSTSSSLLLGVNGRHSTGEEDSELLESLKISENFRSAAGAAPSPVRYEEEMDWSPTQSRYRAFTTYRKDGQSAQGFSQAPVEPQKGPFWYRVPPAPTTPAQRIFNPPNQPRLRKNPVTPSQINFRGVTGQETADDKLRASSHPTTESSSSVTFAQPSFFPPIPQNDPRNTLSDLFTENLALTQDDDQMGHSGSWVGSLMGFIKPKKEASRR
ncbi:hypothetical protein VTK73DRAFT_8505 [Phialemonium thermophilum]|uniref:Ima1 N-terminal domain-containing protein n=1 Tax=Phialemonium thermophilum TaxID=223376 RepID=A0ABR3XNN0_9PEZI